MSEITIETSASSRGLAIAQRYQGFCNYVYPMLINLSGKHRVLRDQILTQMFTQVELFYQAAKSDQVSRLYMADAGLATLREFLRFAAHPDRRLLSRRQHAVAETHLAETGAMLGTWINKAHAAG